MYYFEGFGNNINNIKVNTLENKQNVIYMCLIISCSFRKIQCSEGGRDWVPTKALTDGKFYFYMYCYKVKRKKSNLFITIFSIILIVGLILSFYLLNIKKETNDYEVSITSLSEKKENIKENNDIYMILEDTMKCVVGISNVKVDGISIFNLNKENEWGSGTGFVVSSNGYIITNQHVAGNKGHKTNVTLENGENYIGTTMWSNKDIDIAMIKINAIDLNYLELGDSNSILIGEVVYAIGNPIGFEFQRTVTSRNN